MHFRVIPDLRHDVQLSRDAPKSSPGGLLDGIVKLVHRHRFIRARIDYKPVKCLKVSQGAVALFPEKTQRLSVKHTGMYRAPDVHDLARNLTYCVIWNPLGSQEPQRKMRLRAQNGGRCTDRHREVTT